MRPCGWVGKPGGDPAAGRRRISHRQDRFFGDEAQTKVGCPVFLSPFFFPVPVFLSSGELSELAMRFDQEIDRVGAMFLPYLDFRKNL